MSTLKPHTVNWDQIHRFLKSADKKLVAAPKILVIDEEAALEQAYAAMLRASLAFMFSWGVRPRSQPGHHVAIIDFARQHLDKKHAGVLTVFDRLRRKRNAALYDEAGFISQHDAEEALATACEYLDLIRADIQDRQRHIHPGASGTR